MQTTIWKWRFHWFLCISLRCARFWHGSLPQHLWTYEKHRAQNSFILAPSADTKKNIQKQTNVVKYILIREKKKYSSILLNRCRVQLVPFTDNLYSCANYINLVDGRKNKKNPHTEFSTWRMGWVDGWTKNGTRYRTWRTENVYYFFYWLREPNKLNYEKLRSVRVILQFLLAYFFVLFSSHRYYRTTETVQ